MDFPSESLKHYPQKKKDEKKTNPLWYVRGVYYIDKNIIRSLLSVSMNINVYSKRFELKIKIKNKK